jgi:hypothetical protein
MPSGARLERPGLRAGIHEPTAAEISSCLGADGAEFPSWAARQVLQSRGLAFRKETFPLARQL